MTSNLIETRFTKIGAARAWASLFVIALLVAAVFLEWVPHHLRSFQVFDSGIFLYVGEQLREGSRLYRDVWDHKPPLIYLFNAIGLILAGGSPVGVLLLDYVCCLVFFGASYKELQRLFSAPIAFLAVCFGVLFFRDLAPQPNLGEVVSLPFQIAAFLLLVRDFEQEISLIRASSQAVLFALLFWIRPNGIAISVLYCAVTLLTLVLQRRLGALVRWAFLFFLVSVVATVAIAGPFALLSSWRDVWFATFTFNQIYADLATQGDRLRALWWLIQFAAGHGVLLLAGAGFISIVCRRRLLSSTRSRILLLASAWLMLEFIFAAYTGKQYGKNVIPALLPVMLAIAAFFHFLTEKTSEPRNAALSLRAASVVVSCFAIALSCSQFRENARATPGLDEALISKVRQFSAPSDRVAFWGVLPPGIIFAAQRRPGARFFSSVPLSHGEAAYRLLAPLTLDDLERTRPKLIVQWNDGQIPPLAAQTIAGSSRSQDWDTAELARRKARLMQAYHAVWSNPESKAVIYERY